MPPHSHYSAFVDAVSIPSYPHLLLLRFTVRDDQALPVIYHSNLASRVRLYPQPTHAVVVALLFQYIYDSSPCVTFTVTLDCLYPLGYCVIIYAACRSYAFVGRIVVGFGYTFSACVPRVCYDVCRFFLPVTFYTLLPGFAPTIYVDLPPPFCVVFNTTFARL